MEKTYQVVRPMCRGAQALWTAAVFGLAGSIGAQEEIAYSEVNPNRDCGVYAAGVALSLTVGRDVAFDEIKASIQTDEKGQSSLADVARCLEADGVSIRVEDATELPPGSPCIVALKGKKSEDVNHFVTIRPAPDGRFVVYSPPYWVRIEGWDAIRPKVVGKMLAFGERKPLPLWRIGSLGLGLGVFVGCLVRRFKTTTVGLMAAVAAGVAGFGCQAKASVDELEVIGGSRQNVGSADLTGAFQIAVRNRSERDFTVLSTATSCGCGFVGIEKGFVFRAGKTSRFNVAISLKAGEVRAVDFSVDLKERAQPLRFTLVAHGPKAAGIEWDENQEFGSIGVGKTKTVDLRIILGKGFESLAGPRKEIPAVRWVVSDPGSIHVLSSQPAKTAKWSPGMAITARMEIRCVYEGRRHARVEAICGNLAIPFRMTWECGSAISFQPDVVLLKRSPSALVGESRIRWKGPKRRIESVRSSDPSVLAAIEDDKGESVLRLRAPVSWGDSASPRTEVRVRISDSPGEFEEMVVRVVYLK